MTLNDIDREVGVLLLEHCCRQPLLIEALNHVIESVSWLSSVHEAR